MKDEEYEDLTDIFTTPNESATVLCRKDRAGELKLRKRLTAAEAGHYQRALREVLQRKKLEHENVAELIRVNIDATQQTITSFFEHSKHTAADAIFDNIEGVLKMAVESLRGLAFLHGNDMAHGDIRPGCIGYNEQQRCFKLLERPFWSVGTKAQRERVRSQQDAGVDPESFNLLMSDSREERHSDPFASDVFALGLTIIRVVDRTALDLAKVYDVGTGVFNQNEFTKQLGSLLAQQRHDDYRLFLEVIIKHMLGTDSRRRLTAEQTLIELEALALKHGQVEPEFTFASSNKGTGEAKPSYLGISSANFRSEDGGHSDPPSKLSSYIKKSIANSQRKDSRHELSEKANCEKDSKSVRSHVIGFTADVNEISGESVDYPNGEPNSPKQPRLSYPEAETRDAERDPETKDKTRTEKKMLWGNEYEDIVIEIRSVRKNDNRQREPEVVELDGIDGLKLEFSRAVSDQIQLGYSTGTQSCKRLISTGSLADTPLHLRIKRFKDKSSNLESQVTNSYPMAKPYDSQETIKALKAQPMKGFNLRDHNDSVAKISKSYCNVPTSYKEKLLAYKQRQRDKGLVRSQQYKLSNVNEDNRQYSVLYAGSRADRIKTDASGYRQNSFNIKTREPEVKRVC